MGMETGPHGTGTGTGTGPGRPVAPRCPPCHDPGPCPAHAVLPEGPIARTIPRSLSLWGGRRIARRPPLMDHSNSMMMSSTLRLAPAAALIFLTTPLRSALRMFSIFIASTVASA